MIGGYETTANAIAYVVYLLAAHPEEEAKVVREVDALMASKAGPGSALVAEDLERLPFTGAVLSEALRLFPPVGITSRWGRWRSSGALRSRQARQVWRRLAVCSRRMTQASMLPHIVCSSPAACASQQWLSACSAGRCCRHSCDVDFGAITDAIGVCTADSLCQLQSCRHSLLCCN